MIKKITLLLFLCKNLAAQETLSELFTITSRDFNKSIQVVNNSISGSLNNSLLIDLDLKKNNQLSQKEKVFHVSIPTKNNGVLRLELEPTEILVDDFKVHTPKGDFKMDLPSFYKGRIIGESKSFVSISITKKSFEGLLISDRFNYTIGPIKDDLNNTHIIYESNEIQNPLIEAKDSPVVVEATKSNLPTPNIQQIEEAVKKAKSLNSAVGTVKVYLEADYQMYVDWGFNTTYVVNQMTAIFNNVALLFANENVNIQLSSIYVWTEPDPYSGYSSTFDVLSEFAKKTSFNGDIAHLVSTRSYDGATGVAFLGVGTPVYGNMTSRAVFNDCRDQTSAFGLSTQIQNSVSNIPAYSFNVNIIAHELGHNFGLPHTHSCSWPGGAIDNCGGAEGDCTLPPTQTGSGTIMSYCHLSNIGINFINGFGQLPGDKMRAEVATATCLTNSCSSVDWLMLQDFYLRTGGDNWINKTGWDVIKNSSYPPTNCTFNGVFGVTSSIINGRERVVKLELPNNNLVGTFSQFLSSAINLIEVNLSNNQMSGAIPNNIGNLNKLQKLNLQNNQLTNKIPAQLGNITSLTNLFLNSNQLSGCYDVNLKKLCNRLINYDISTNNSGLLATWTNFCSSNQGICTSTCSPTDYAALRDLYISTNGDNWYAKTGWDLFKNNPTPPAACSFAGIHGISYTPIDGIDRISKINLISNNLNGILPNSIGTLTELLELNIHFNSLTGNLPSQIGNLSKLIRLNISDNQLTGGIPVEIGNLSKIQYLILGNNKFTGNIPTQISQLTDLIILSLYTNQLTGSIPSNIGNLTKLKYLFLYKNILTGNIPSSIGKLAFLLWLDLSSNQLTGSIPITIGTLNSLTLLNLFNNQLSGSIPESIGNITNLGNITLLRNQLSGTIPTSIGNLSKLLYLNIGENLLTGSLISELGELTQLQQLGLYKNQLSGTIPPVYGNLTRLVELTLHNNFLTGSIPNSIGNLTNLSFLSLNNNQLTGSIPTTLGNLRNLTSLNAGNNQLSGSIPSELGNLTNIQHIQLYSNGLTGSIPIVLGSLSTLISLNLYENQLNGTIPQSLGNLTNLIMLYLNNNQLSGTIPSRLGNLKNLKYIGLHTNQLSGCYSSNLRNICSAYGDVSQNNTGLLATWTNFCSNNAGVCPCQDIIILQSTSNDINSGTQIFETNQVTGQINASNKITGNANITLRAGKNILLLPGFLANQGVVFKTEQGGCN